MLRWQDLDQRGSRVRPRGLAYGDLGDGRKTRMAARSRRWPMVHHRRRELEAGRAASHRVTSGVGGRRHPARSYDDSSASQAGAAADAAPLGHCRLLCEDLRATAGPRQWLATLTIVSVKATDEVAQKRARTPRPSANAASAHLERHRLLWRTEVSAAPRTGASGRHQLSACDKRLVSSDARRNARIV